MPIPNYLKHLAVSEKQKHTWTYFSIQCPCGCDTFTIYENYLNKEEKALEKPYCDALTEMYAIHAPRMTTCDENGVQHIWRLLEDGSRKEIIVPAPPFFSGITVIKIKCAACGKEHLIFDSRIHGYDGMTGKHAQETLAYEPHFKLKCKNAVSLQIKVENDETCEEFLNLTSLDFSEKQYADSFGWIIIYKIDEKGKKTKIFDWETS